MSTVTVSKSKYDDLKRRASAYDRIIATARKDMFGSPPTRDIKSIIREFQATKKYSPTFLKSIEGGLCRSPHFKNN